MMRASLYRPGILSLATAVLFAATLFGCGTEPDRTTVRYLFEQTYVNAAWGYHYNGMYVDSDGFVWLYDWRTDPTPPPSEMWQGYDDPSAITKNELDAKYAPNRQLVRRLDQDEIDRMEALIAGAARGDITPRVQAGADIGSSRHVAFLFDPKTETYREVLLKETGDWTRHNTSPEAEAIVQWLDAIH